MRCPYCIKICSKCNRLLVANSMNFAKQKTCKYGFESKCKECYKKYNKERKAKKEKERQEIEKNNIILYKVCTKCKKELPATTEYFSVDSGKYGLKSQCKECQKKYSSEHKEHIAEYGKQWNENNRERKNELGRKAKHKRRAKLKSNGGEYTLEQWQECLEFFDYKCAYSGAELTKDNTNIEHIIPISKGGTNNIYNIVPALDTVNKSKGGKDMHEWYKEQPYYSEERLNKILDWIEYASNKYELNTIVI